MTFLVCHWVLMTHQRALVISVLPRTNGNLRTFFPQLLNWLGPRRHYLSCAAQTVFNQMASWIRQVQTQKNTMHHFKIVSIFTYLALREFCLFPHGHHIVLAPAMTRVNFLFGQDVDVILYHLHWEWRERDSNNTVKSRMFIQFKITLCVAPNILLDLTWLSHSLAAFRGTE